MAKTYTVTLQDAHTKASMTAKFPGDITMEALLTAMAQNGTLSIPVRRATIPGWGELPRDTTMEEALGEELLRTGFPLQVYLQETMDPRLRSSGAVTRLFREYPLVFFRKVGGVCVQRIDYVCLGYELPGEILARMVREGKLPAGARGQLMPWGHREGQLPPGASFGKIQVPVLLCEMDPKPGTVFILEEAPGTGADDRRTRIGR